MRLELLQRREERQAEIDAGVQPDFLAATRDVRESEWTVAPAPADLDDRRVEITGPAEPKMMINALNSGARVFMADLEDALSPTWANVVGGQAAIADAIRGTLTFDSPEGKAYRLDERAGHARRPAARLAPRRVARARRRRADLGIAVRLRAVPVPQRRRAASRRGAGRTSTCAKLESHHEARLWNEVFVHAPDGARASRAARSGRPSSSRRSSPPSRWTRSCTSCASTPPGLNAGRWDYLFSAIKKFRTDAATCRRRIAPS